MATLFTGQDPAQPAAVPSAGSVWRLEADLNGYARSSGTGLATQLAAGRCLRVIDDSTGTRLRVRLLEDGYPCWLDAAELLRHGQPATRPVLPSLDQGAVAERLGQVLAFALEAMARPNAYLWGGTLGPDYDCSGLVQSAFAAAGIWVPRDAYLQERFCRPVAVRAGEYSLLRPADLIFFGSQRRCTHVGIHLGGGRYLHSSGREHGRNGIGIDDLHPGNDDPVACHYRGELRGAGRVMHSHDGSPLPP
jgi:hypothetical protein